MSIEDVTLTGPKKYYWNLKKVSIHIPLGVSISFKVFCYYHMYWVLFCLFFPLFIMIIIQNPIKNVGLVHWMGTSHSSIPQDEQVITLCFYFRKNVNYDK